MVTNELFEYLFFKSFFYNQKQKHQEKKSQLILRDLWHNQPWQWPEEDWHKRMPVVCTPMWPFVHASEQAAGKMAKQSKMGNTWKRGSTTQARLFLSRCCTRGPSRFFLFCWCLCISTVSGTGVYLLLVRSKSFLYSTFQQSMRQLCSAANTCMQPLSHI